ncbi:MAG: hypothetical protein Q7J54_03045 [Candidatus Woesearchaeota archaeon]|nr:hypothetical protein [Candidatus Woesearchaeota archaeon]
MENKISLEQFESELGILDQKESVDRISTLFEKVSLESLLDAFKSAESAWIQEGTHEMGFSYKQVVAAKKVGNALYYFEVKKNDDPNDDSIDITRDESKRQPTYDSPVFGPQVSANKDIAERLVSYGKSLLWENGELEHEQMGRRVYRIR